MRVLRSSLFVAATAIVAAACGDKVNVTQPSGAIHGVQVSPSTATLSVNQSLTFTAAVTADAGITPTVTWSANAPGGVFLATAATPGVAVCATATAPGAGSASNCATVVVTAAGTVTPAVLQIASVTTANLNTPAPVPPGVVAGQINVSVNVNPGTEKIDSVQVLLNGKVAGTQVFTDAQAAMLRSAGDAAIAAQGLLPTLVFSINTAAYNTTTGAVTFPNGALTISAVAFGHQGSSAATNSAAQSAAYILGNADGFQVTLTNNGHAANDATGYAWWGNGTLTVNAIPVMYSGKTVGTVTASLGSGATGSTCVAGVGTAVSSTTATAGAYAIVLPLAAAQSPAGCTTTTPNLPLITAIDASGNVIALGGATNAGGAASFTGVLNAQTGVRFDNVAPPAPIVNASTAAVVHVAAAGSMPKGRTSFWLNDAVTFNGLATTNVGGTVLGTTSNGLICDNKNAAETGNCVVAAALSVGQLAAYSVTAPVDAGVGGAVDSMHVAATTTAATAAAAPALTSSASLAPSVNNSTYCGVAFSTDALGNTSPANPVAGAAATTCAAQITGGDLNVVTFGVDRAAPTIAFAGGLASNARINTATLAGEFIVTVADTGAVGNSGMAPVAAGATAGPVLMLLNSRTAATSTTGTNLDAIGGATTSTVPISTNVGFAAPLGTTGITGQSTVGAAAAYWTVTALAQDAAGNQSATISRVVVGDNSAVIGTSPAVPASITGSFSAAAFLNDNLSIRDYYYTVGYNTALIAPVTITLAAAPTVVDAYNAATFSNTNFAINTTVNTYLGLQDGTTTPPSAFAGANLMNALNLFARDQAQAAYTAVAPTVVAPTAPAAGVTIAAAFTGAYVGTTSAATLCATAAASGGCTVATATPATVTWTATATGATGTFNNPFSRVDFYAANGTDLVFVGSVAAASATLVDNGTTRVWTYTFAAPSANALFTQLGGVSGGTPGAAITRNVYAFGANTAGTVALVNAPVAQTINP